jgi:hypothetical protein
MPVEAEDAVAASRWRRLGHRLLALLLVSLFAGVQTIWWLDGRRYREWWEPTRVLGPLYFLANKSAEDDWLGIVLLVVLVPCILAFVLWPTRFTTVLACLAILASVGPGIFLIWRDAP